MNDAGIGKLDPEFYSLVTMHGTILVFFVLTAGLSGTFANPTAAACWEPATWPRHC